MNTSALDAFQHAFWTGLWAPVHNAETEAPASAPDWQTQPGWAVYRNTVIKGCVDTLLANYPAVATLVGEEWLRAVAAEYVTAHPPADRRMLFYGEGFEDFLASFPPAADLPYLGSVARLDRLWREAHAAAEAPRLPLGGLAVLAPDALQTLVLQPHPSARWAWFPELPAGALWRAAREHWSDPNPPAWEGDGLLLTRNAEGAVQWQPLDAGGAALLDACAQGLPLPEAAGAALNTDPTLDLTALLQTLLAAGAFRAFDIRPSPLNTGEAT
jgi:hypothetical protein